MSDDLSRKFEGAEVLQKLLTRSGTLADVDDVAAAFTKAIADGVPANVVIQALWEDEPRFERPTEARALFSNLLGLYDVIAEKGSVDLTRAATPRLKLAKARPPDPFETEPTQAWLEAAGRYFEDHPKERQKLQHAFDNREDALVTWLDASDFSDEGFGTAHALCADLFAFLELGGREVTPFDERSSARAPTDAPQALIDWVDDALLESTEDEDKPLPEAQAQRVREAVLTVLKQWWQTASTR